MTAQTMSRKCLGGSPAGNQIPRMSTLTLAAMLFTIGAAAGAGPVQSQVQPDAGKPKPTIQEKKPAAEPAEKIVGNYLVHQSLEVGGRITTMTGSNAMWDTLVNQGSGGRVLSQSLEMHSVNTSKTPFFDSLTGYSTGYGGDPLDVTRLKISKGRWYDFSGSFRRDRQYFDYNLLDQSLLGPTALVPEPDSLHLFNTVRRNTDTNLTILPLSFISFRAAFNHGTHEGPTYTTLHDGGDVQLLQWFRNSSDTYTGGVDVKLAPRTTLSYDQFYVFYKGDSSFSLAGANYQTGVVTPGIPPILTASTGMESLGVDTLATAKCGTASATASKNTSTLEVVGGIANPFCSGTLVMTQSAPTRTTFPTEQLRFSSHYWGKVAMNGRVLYSGGTSNVNSFNETFTGLLTRTYTLQEIDTGGLANGGLAHNKRINMNADYGIEAELNKYISVSDAFNYWNFRVEGMNAATATVWDGTKTTPNLNILTPLSAVTETTSTTTNSSYLDQKTASNTALATAAITPQVKISGGWRYRDRVISDPSVSSLTFHEQGLLLGAVIQPSSALRLNVNYDTMNSKYSSGTAVLNETIAAATSTTAAVPALALLPSNTFTREAPDKSGRFRARATIKPAKWVNFAVTASDYSAKNDDPQVNHFEHNRDLSFAAAITPGAGFSLDFNYAHDNVYSSTDLCYIYTASATAPLPPGAANGGTCVNSATNPEGSASLYLGGGSYNAPSNFFSGVVNYSPSKYFYFNGGVRLNNANGMAEQLNPLMVPGALHSKYTTPYSDLQFNIAPQWVWHGNWTHDGYAEGGPVGLVSARNTHGDIVTLGVKYAF